MPYVSSDEMIYYDKSEAGFSTEGFYSFVFPISCLVQRQKYKPVAQSLKRLFLCGYKSEKMKIHSATLAL